jgi:hypothetical protein
LSGGVTANIRAMPIMALSGQRTTRTSERQKRTSASASISQELDYPKLTTLDRAVSFIKAKLGSSKG